MEEVALKLIKTCKLNLGTINDNKNPGVISNNKNTALIWHVKITHTKLH
jgi:hypothetical protein